MIVWEVTERILCSSGTVELAEGHDAAGHPTQKGTSGRCGGVVEVEVVEDCLYKG